MAVAAKHIDSAHLDTRPETFVPPRPNTSVTPQSDQGNLLFSKYFSIEFANTPTLLSETFRLRGDVYCKEFGYESEADCPGGLERDEYDAQALHCLIVHRQKGIAAGCVRLVPTLPTAPARPLPMERFCGDSFTHPTLSPTVMPRHNIAEISRLAVHTIFRRRNGERGSPDGLAEVASFNDEERRTFPLISAALVLSAIAMAVLSGQTNGFAMMEPRLARLLQRMGIDLVQIGDLMNYHGQRAGFYFAPLTTMAGIQRHLGPLYSYIFHSIAESYRQNDGSAAKRILGHYSR